MEPVITTEHLSFDYEQDKKKFKVLKDIDLSLFPGDRVAILGGSGSGKTTLLNILALLATGTGRITYCLHASKYTVENGYLTYLKNGRLKTISKDQLRQRFGFVFQTPFMLGNFDALYNIGLSLRQQGVAEATIKTTAKQMADYLRLSEREQRRSADGLSGGQRQRVAIGRALLHQPAVVFADEPTGNLDEQNAKLIMELLQEKCNEMKTALVLVTHNLCLAETYAEKIFCLMEGTLVEKTAEFSAYHERCQQLFDISCLGESF